MCTQEDLGSGVGYQDSQNLNFSTFSTIKPPILWWSRFLEGRFTILREDRAVYPILALVQWPMLGLLSLCGLGNALPGAARFTLLKLCLGQHASHCWSYAWGSTLHTAEAMPGAAHFTLLKLCLWQQASHCWSYAWGSTLHTAEAIKQFVHVLNKHSCGQLPAAEHPYKKQKYRSSSKLVSVSQLAKLKNKFPTRNQLHYNKLLYL
jgi:hypothetical protein